MLSDARVSISESQCGSTIMPCAPTNIWFHPLLRPGGINKYITTQAMRLRDTKGQA